MENAGAMIEGGEWSSFSGVYVHEEADFMAQLFPNCSATNEPDGGSGLALGPPCWTSHESNYHLAGADDGSIYTSETSNSNLYTFPHSSYSGGSSVVYPNGGHESYYLSDTHQFLTSNNSSVSIDFLMSDPKSHVPIQDFPEDRVDGGDDCLNLEMSSGTLEESGPCLTECEISGKHLILNRDSDISELDPTMEEKNGNDYSSNNTRKRTRGSDVQKSKRNVKSKKNQKLTLDINNEDDNNAGINRQISGTCSSEDESNASQDLTVGATSCLSSKGAAVANSNGKTRASRGSATDPQSLYARKRRERINERLRILQNLVPNGTKVDISTMLEEAVHYVKFLQVQIKLLSSDDMWMYAPLAYNGMDLGLDLNMSVPR